MNNIQKLLVDAGEVWAAGDAIRDDLEERTLQDFTGQPTPVEWSSENPFAGQSKEELLAWLTKQPKWRYHHGLPELTAAGNLYDAYALRTDTMLQMVDKALALAGVDVASSSFVDLGAAEGYVGNHLYDLGARDIDSCELNEMNLDRTWCLRAYTDRAFGRVGRIDLDNVRWSSALGRQYDVVLALGIIYHMENPLLFCRNLFEVAPVVVLESDTPNFPNNQRFRGFGNIYMHQDQLTLSLGNVRRLLELRPDRQAAAEMLLNAGYTRVQAVTVSGDQASKYFANGDKSVLVATR